MIRRNWRWLGLLPVLLLLGLIALGIYAYTVVPASLAERAEAEARSFYLERQLNGPWDSIHSLDIGGRFTLARGGAGLLDWNPTWCLIVDAQGRRGGRPVSDRSEWMAWQNSGGWAMGIIKVPWSSLSAGACQ